MRKIALLLSTLAIGIVAQAQVTLTGTSYTQNFDNIGTGLPLGWTVRNMASATALGTDLSSTNFLATPAANTTWNNTTGSFKNFASANGFANYAAGTVTLQTAATDRALGVRQVAQTSSTFPSDSGVAFVLQITNTTGLNNFNLSFKLQTLDSLSGRITTWRVDYGFGATPTSFTAASPVGTLTTGGTMYANNTVTVNFGTALNNQSGPVWIRIAELGPTTGAGNRTSSAIDDFVLSYTAGGPVSNRPNIVSLLPANGANNVAPGSNLQITFDKQVTKGAVGSIVIRNQTDQTFVIKPTASADVSVSGNVATVTNTGLAIGKTYFVVFDSLSFDTAGFRNVGIYDSTAWKFTVPAPNFRATITPVNPTDNATSLPANPNATLMMRFSRRVAKGTTGNIVVKNETDQTSQTIAVTSADVTLNTNGDTASVANVALVAGKAYHVLVDSVAFDTAGYHTLGIVDTTRWNFSVQGPVITVTSLNEQFDASCSSNALPAGWLQYSVTGPTQFWKCNASTTGNFALVMNGGGATSSTANEDWLITPKLNLAGQTNPMLTFKGKYRFAGLDMEVKYSTNYTGAGDPNLATWTDIQGISFSTADSNTFATKMASLTVAPSVFVAFKYTSGANTPSNGREWSVDSVVVADMPTGVHTINSNSNNMPVQVIGTAVNGNVTVAFDMANGATVQAAIYDLAGRSVYQQSINAAKGKNTILLTPQTLQSGMYIIRLTSGTQQGIARTFIQ